MTAIIFSSKLATDGRYDARFANEHLYNEPLRINFRPGAMPKKAKNIEREFLTKLIAHWRTGGSRCELVYHDHKLIMSIVTSRTGVAIPMYDASHPFCASYLKLRRKYFNFVGAEVWLKKES